jgi:hypothetical protein
MGTINNNLPLEKTLFAKFMLVVEEIVDRSITILSLIYGKILLIASETAISIENS